MSAATKPPSIAIHGGAGNLARYKGTGRLEEANEFLSALIDSLHADALQGETALNIVTNAVVAMEDCGLFHAGKGSSPSTNGLIELDASIMDGATLQVGGVI